MNRLEPSRTYASPSRRAVRTHRGRVGARAGFRQRVGTQPLAGGEAGQVPRLLLVVSGELEPERAELLDGEDERARRAHLRHLLDRDEREERPRTEPSVLLLEEGPEDVVLAKELDHVPRKLVAFVDLGARGAIRSRASCRTRSRSSRCSSVSGSYATAESLCSSEVILENGVVRTMEPTLPVARALAIAGDRVAGGIGTHEAALAPRTESTWAGGVSSPASRTRTSTSPPGHSPSARSGSREPPPWTTHCRGLQLLRPRSSRAAGSGAPVGARATGRRPWSPRRRRSTASPGTRPPR